MNLVHSMIATTCRGCVADGNFTEAQRRELISILEKFENTNPLLLWDFKKYLQIFDDKYAEFGGDVTMLESRIQKIRDEQYISAMKAVPGLKIKKVK